jgi:peptidoglycan hydrolase-like protein with peptidoglycan-binding domain
MPFFYDDEADTLPAPPRSAPTVLSLSGGVGDGEENASDNVHALDETLRHANPAYRPADYPQPQRYIHGPLVDGVRDFQKRHELPETGRVRPGDDTEAAINNRLLNKPRGAGLLTAPYAPIRREVGDGRANDSADVVNVKRAIAAIGYGAEHPRDKPNDWVGDDFFAAIRQFQQASNLTPDGWLAPGGETETAVRRELAALAARLAPAWRAYVARAQRAGKIALAPAMEMADGGIGRFDASDAIADESSEGISTAPRIVTVKQPSAGSSTGQSGSSRTGTPNVPPAARDYRTPQDHRPQRKETFDPRNYMGNRSGEPIIPPERSRRDGETSFVNPGERPPLRRPPFTPWHPLPDEIRRDPIGAWRAQTEWEARYGRPAPGWQVYTPAPGDALAIPLAMVNPDGRPGKPHIQVQNRELAEEFIKACKEVFPNAKIKHIGGGDVIEEFFVKPIRKQSGRSKTYGGSYPDSTVEMKIGEMELFGHFDTFVYYADGTPTTGEQKRFGRLYRNEAKRNSIHIRMPKLEIGEEIDKEALRDFVRELCREIERKIKDDPNWDFKKKRKVVEIFESKKERPRQAKEEK